jgi:hypothetical protein
VVHRDREYFGAKSKGYDAKMKRAVKEYHLGTKEIFKAGKVLVITTQRVNLKMLCDIFLL